MRFKLFLTNLLIVFSVFLIFSTFFVSPGKATAQSASSILIDLIPPNPSPFENVTISLSSYASNLDTVLISWSVNGQNVSSGIGKKSLFTQVPASGSEVAVVATISLPAGTVEKRVIIRPAVMVLLWQANDSYVPPFYRGKALPTADSEVKVVAMPEMRSSTGGLVDPKNMTYAWKKDYTNNQEGSGYGKNFFIYTNDYLESVNNVSVTAQTIDQGNSSAANISIGTTQPKISFYKNDPDLGTIWEAALANPHRISGNEIVVAVPYFISPKQIQNPRLVFSWFINGVSVPIQSSRKNVMPLAVQAGTSGTSKLRLDIENRDKIFQSTSREINMEF